jgi:RTX calcium-binding nonapeptide repeat (4 copies)/Bacterial pre-peptidase C-terminal domain
MIARLISRHGFSDANSSSTDDMAQFLPQDDGSALISDLVYRQPSLPASSAAQTDSSESSSVPGRADFGSATPVRTGIPDTTSVGTTGNFVNQDINGILSGSAWNVTNVTYSFPTSASFYGSGYSDPAPANGFQTLSAAQQAVAEYAFSLISQYTPLTFTQITETSTTHAMIRLADSSYPATSYAYYPAASDTGGDVFYGNIRNDTPTKAGYAFDTILHEIGHAVGLKHGQDDDGTHGVLPSSHDSTEWSIMDYHPYIGGPLYYSNSDGSGNQTYMTDDISALQYLYGANFNSNSSNTVYTWSPTTGQEFINGIGQGASSTDTVYEAIWDGNGIDTYDLSNYTTSLSIDLQPGDWSTFSSTQLANLDSGAPGVHLAPGNIINANEYNNDARSLIENADGGSGNDTLVGNTANNVLRGGAGNDSLYGGAGTDTAVFSGTQSQYTVTWTSGTNYTVVGPDGSDQLHDIELVQFGAAAPVAIGVAADDYRGDASTTGTLTAGGSVNAVINFAGDTDWFRTTLTAGTTYWFNDEGSPTGQGTLPDTFLRLLNSTSVQVATDDDSGAGLNSFISYTPTTTGTYYVSAQAFGSNTGTYRLSERVADDYTGNPATTGTLAAGGSVSANISFNGDTDWFRTTLTAGTTYWFNDEGSATGQGTLSDPLLRLLSNDGATQVSSNDDSGAGLNSFISYTPTATGTYYLSAQAFGGNTGTYRLSEQVADDYAGNPSSTGALAVGSNVAATINFAGDTDWFHTSLTAGTTYWFSEEGSPTGQGTLPDTYLRLLSNDGATLVSSNDDSGVGFNSFVSYTPTVTGTYYLSAQAFGTNTGTYHLSETVADDYAGNPATTGTLAAGGSVSANISFNGDTDWFRTTLTAGTTYVINDEGSPTGQGTLPDTYLRLLSNDGATLVASDDDGGVGTNSLITYTPTVTGTYYLSAQAFGSNTGTYRLSEATAGPAQLPSSSNRMSFIGGSDSLLASSTTIPTSNGTTLSSESTSIPFPHGVAIESFSAVTPTTQELWQVSGAGSAAGLDHGAPPSASSPVVDLSQTTSVSMLATHQLG